jgi:WD40 repeat protein
LAGGSTGRARIYCLASGEIRESLGRDVDPVFSAAFSPCGTVRALGSKTAVLLSAESPGVVPSCAGEQSKLQEIAVSSDLDMDWRAELRLTGHDQLGECRCSARNRHPACPVEGHRGKISAVAFSPHGALSCRVVASGSHDATVLLQLRALLDQSWPRGLCGLIGPIDVELRSSFGVWRRAACFAPLPSRRRSSPTTRGDRDAVSGPRLILMASDPRCQVFSLAFGRDWVRDQQRLAAACALHRRLGQASRLATLDQAFLLPFLMWVQRTWTNLVPG